MSDIYKTSLARILGLIHVVCGLVALSTGIGIIVTARSPGLHFVGTGIWTSVFFFVAGGLSIGSSYSVNGCLVIGTLVMSIFSSIVGGILLIMSSISMSFERVKESEVCLGLQIVVGLLQLVLPVVSSALACHATCCRPKMGTDTGHQVLYTGGTGGITDISQLEQILGGKLVTQSSVVEDQTGEEQGDFLYKKLVD